VIEVDGDGTDIPDRLARLPEFRHREFKITKAILEKYGHTPDCKGCEAVRNGTDARRHSDECRQSLEVKMQDDEALKARLNMRDMRLEREPKAPPAPAEVGEPAPATEVDIDDGMGDAAAAGEAFAAEALKNKKNLISQEKEEEDKKKEEPNKEEEKRGREESDDQRESKRRRMALLASEARLRGMVASRRVPGGNEGSSLRYFDPWTTPARGRGRTPWIFPASSELSKRRKRKARTKGRTNFRGGG